MQISDKQIQKICRGSFFSFFFLACLIASLAGKPTRAENQELSLGIWPPILELTIQPGRSFTQKYTIFNTGNSLLKIIPQISRFQPADEMGNIKLEEETSQEENDWFSFQPPTFNFGQTFDLPAGKSLDLSLKIAPPLKAKEDDYYFSFFLQTSPTAKETSSSVVRSQAKIATNILLAVSQTGQPARKAIIKEFQLINCGNFQLPGLPCLIDSFDQPRFFVKIGNQGRSFFKPIGRIVVGGWLGQSYILNLFPSNILVGSSRIINCQENTSGTEISPASQPCRLAGRFFLGPYRAELAFGPDSFNNQYRQTLVFWAIPGKLLLSLLTTTLIILMIKSKANHHF